MMQASEQLAINIRERHRQVFNGITEKYHGRILQYYGDGTLSIFSSIVDAVNCAVEMQKSFREIPAVPVRIGIHCGDITLMGDEIAGDGVNIASRIEALAVPGCVMISRRVYEEIKNHAEFKVKSYGKLPLKNVNTPVWIYALANDGLVVPDAGKIRQNAFRNTGMGPTARRILLAAVTLFLITVLYSLFLWYKQGELADRDLRTKSIAVLPFVNLSNDPSQDYFSDGMTADLLSQLSRINDLRVVSRTSVMQYKNTTKTIRKIADELDATHILEGSVRKYGNQLRIAVNLIEASSDYRLWSVDFDRDLEDVLKVQREVSLEVVKLLQANLTEAERTRVEKIPTTSQQAYDLYQRGQSIIRQTDGTRTQMDEAVRLFQEAISMDSNFSLAYVGLAETYLGYATWGRIAPREALPKAMEAAQIAKQLDDQSGECYQILGAIYLYNQDYETAELYLQKAIELSPNYVESYAWLGKKELIEGNLNHAVELFQKAQELDPLSSQYVGLITFSYYLTGQYKNGIKASEETLRTHPTDNFLLWNLGNVYIGLEEYDKAIEVFNKRSIGTCTNWSLGYAYGRAGRIEEAQSILDYHLELVKNEYVPAIMISAIYMGMGRTEEAIQWLERAMDEGVAPILFPEITIGVKFEPLRSDPRFRNILKRGSSAKTTTIQSKYIYDKLHQTQKNDS